MELPADYTLLSIKQRKKVREEYIRRQKGKCWYCKSRLDGDPPVKVRNLSVDPNLFPRGFFDHPVHLHHSHETGITIGAVHSYCNAVLWEYHGE